MLTISRTMAAPEAAGEIVRMERVSDTPRPTTAAETAPKRDPTIYYRILVSRVHANSIPTFLFR